MLTERKHKLLENIKTKMDPNGFSYYAMLLFFRYLLEKLAKHRVFHFRFLVAV